MPFLPPGRTRHVSLYPGSANAFRYGGHVDSVVQKLVGASVWHLGWLIKKSVQFSKLHGFFMCALSGR